MNDENIKELKDLIFDMRSRCNVIRSEAYALLEKAKTIEAESYTLENKFSHLLYPDE